MNKHKEMPPPEGASEEASLNEKPGFSRIEKILASIVAGAVMGGGGYLIESERRNSLSESQQRHERRKKFEQEERTKAGQPAQRETITYADYSGEGKPKEIVAHVNNPVEVQSFIEYILRHDPDWALHNADMLREAPFGAILVKRCAERFPGGALQHFDDYENVLPDAIEVRAQAIRELTQQMREKKDPVAIEYLLTYGPDAYYDDGRTVPEGQDPTIYYEKDGKLQKTEPRLRVPAVSDEILRETAETAISIGRSELLLYWPRQLIDKGWAKDLFIEAAKKNPRLAESRLGDDMLYWLNSPEIVQRYLDIWEAADLSFESLDRPPGQGVIFMLGLKRSISNSREEKDPTFIVMQAMAKKGGKAKAIVKKFFDKEEAEIQRSLIYLNKNKNANQGSIQNLINQQRDLQAARRFLGV